MLASIWLVIETSRWRITSKVIGSTAAPSHAAVSCPAPAGHPVTRVPSVELMRRPNRATVVTDDNSGVGSALSAMDADFAQRPDLEPVARPDQGRGSVFFDQGRPGLAEARGEGGAIVNLRVQCAGSGAERNRA